MFWITRCAKRVLLLSLFSVLLSGCQALSVSDDSAQNAMADSLMGTGDLGLIVAPAPAATLDLSTGQGFALRGDVVGHAPDVAVGDGDAPFLFGGAGEWRADFVHTGGGMLAFELTALGALDLSAATLVIDLHGEDLDNRITVGPDPMSQPVDAATTLSLSGAMNLGRSPKLVFETPLPASPVSVALWAIPNQQMMCGGFFASQALAVSVEVR